MAFGEIGLTGELRPVAYGEERLREAAKQGFTAALIPRDNAPRAPIEGLKIHELARLEDALAIARGRQAVYPERGMRTRKREAEVARDDASKPAALRKENA